MNKPVLDLIIIGGGPTGISCGIEAKKAGLNFIIIEKGVLVNSIFNFPTNMTFFSTSLKLEIGDVPFISHNDKPTRAEALEYYRRLVEGYDLPIYFNEEFESYTIGDVFEVKTSKGLYLAKNIIVATGFYDTPRKLNIKGENLPKVKHYYDEAHLYIKQNVLVIGAANSACDVALETWQKGANVTMVVRRDTLYPKVKYWILPNIQNRIKEGSIKAYFNSNVMEIRDKEVIVSTPEGIITIPNEYVLAMTGYKPNYDLLYRMKLAIADDEHLTPIFNADTFESSVQGIYLAGVVQGGLATSSLFIENTREHGKIIVDHIQQTI